ncbi:MAG: hypothetical protein ACM31C_30945 [Acidobacteriota bacterium]
MRRLAVLALLLVALPAGADDEPEIQRMRFVERGDDLTVTTSITKLFDASAFTALGSGFLTTVEIQMWVYPKESTEPISYYRLVRSAVYDMWDEIYTVKQCDACKPVKVRSPADALRLLTSLDDVPTGAKLLDIPYEDIYYLAIRADLNPVSKETLAEVRRWLSQSTGGGLDRGSVFFGNFVSVFVNPKIAEADRVLRVRSQPFYRPRP